MTDFMDANQEPASSTSSETLDATVSSDTSSDTAAADPSPATDVGSEDTLSIVRDVVESRDPENQASSADGAEPGAQPGEPATEQKAEPDNENYSDVPFHKHPRFQQLLRENKAHKVDAVRYQHVQRFLDDQGLSAEETADGLVIMGLAKTNPAEAWKRALPWLKNLAIAAGEVLPEDLNARVQKGEIPADVAIEMSRNRAGLESVQAAQTFREQQARQRAVQEHSQNLVSTADAWIADRQTRDPNYAAKEPQLKKELLYIWSMEGKATSVEKVRDQLDRAYKAIVLPAAPKPRPQQSRLPMSGQVSGNPMPEPQSTLDIIRAERARRNS